MVVRSAAAQDLPVVQELLRAAGLPTAGVAEAFGRFVVAGKPPVGAAGLELYGQAALLRSVVVAPERRGQGLGTRLVHGALDTARIAGIKRVYLLTETAPEFFRRLGFRDVPRATVDPAVRASVEFTSACPQTARCMRLNL